MYKQGKQQGTSLLEILIALIVLGIGLTSIIVFQSNVTTSDTLAEQRTEASHLAQQQIENLRDIRDTAAYNALQSANATQVTGTGLNINTQYNISWSMDETTTAAGGNGNYKTMNVKVQWLDKKGESQEVNLQTVAAIGQNEVQKVASLASTLPPDCIDFNSDKKDDDTSNDLNDDHANDGGSAPDDDYANYDDDNKNDDKKENSGQGDGNDDHAVDVDGLAVDDGVNDDTYDVKHYCKPWGTLKKQLEAAAKLAARNATQTTSTTTSTNGSTTNHP